MTLAMYGKTRRRQMWLVTAALLAIMGATFFAVGHRGGEAAPEAQFAVYTSIENVTDTSECPNGGGGGVNCNIYEFKQQVYLNGGPSSDFLPDGYYCFSVYNPDTDILLSQDGANQRSFQVLNGDIVYTGSHDVGADSRTADVETTIQFFPFADTTNPGGVYKFTLYQYASAPTQPTTAGSECTQTGVVVQKTDNFKVRVNPVITIEKTNNQPNAVLPGTTVNYTLTITVTGEAINNADIVDDLPAGIGAPVSAISHGGVYSGGDGGTITWNDLDLPVGQTVLTYTATVQANATAGGKTNVATITSPACENPGSDCSDDSVVTVVIPALPSISKAAGTYNTTSDTASFTITIDNSGANAIARNVTITDTGATLTAVSPNASACGSLPDTSPFGCAVAAGQVLTLTVTKVQGQACAAGSVINTASATLTGGTAPLPGSPTAQVSVTVPADESLCGVPTISKVAGTFNAADDTASFTVTIDNSGANAIARNVTITDADATLTAASIAGACGTLPDTSPFVCDVAAGATLTLTVTKPAPQACQPGSVSNVASAVITGGASLGGSPTASVSVTIPADQTLCDVPSIAKQAGSFDTNTDLASFTITITNTGANAIDRNVTITDTGATLQSVSPTATACGALTDTSPFDCAVLAGQTLTLTVTKPGVQACAAGSVTNSASAVLANTETALGGSPTGEVSVTIPADTSLCPVPTLSKSAGTYNTATDLASFTVTINNSAAGAINRNVTVTDAGATLQSTSGSGSCSPTPDPDGSFDCTVPAGGTLVLTVTKAQGQACQAGTVTNSASAAVVGGPALGGSPTATVSVDVPADEALCGVPQLSKLAVGFNTTTDLATFTITINNNVANAIARNVTITDAGATLISVSPNATACGSLPDSSPYVCDVAAGQVLTLTVTRPGTQACEPGSVANTASGVITGGATLGGSPTGSVSVTIPADTGLCPTPTPPTPTPTQPPATPTPTNTPTPTATPTNTPTNTPTPVSTQAPASPTPIEEVAGVRTPAPPSAGTGQGAASSSMSMLLLVAGLVAMGGGFFVLATYRRRVEDD